MDIAQFIANLLQALGVDQGPIIVGNKPGQSIPQVRAESVQQPVQQPVRQPIQQQVPTPVPQTFAITPETVSSMIKIYGGQDAPVLNQAPFMAQTASQYDFWKNNPELLALIPHLETSSGRYITRPNNNFNWGINYPGNNEAFSKMTPEAVTERAISGIGERSPYYKKFRTGAPLTDNELLDFAKVYEPANGSYGPNLIEGRKHIRANVQIP